MDERVTVFGSLLLEAMARKGAETGARYSYRDLERDSGVNYSHAARVVRGGRRPSRELVESLANALRPYLPLDQALIAAGYLPESERGRDLVRQLWPQLQRASEEVERRLRMVFLEGVPPEGEAGEPHEGEADHDEPQPEP